MTRDGTVRARRATCPFERVKPKYYASTQTQDIGDQVAPIRVAQNQVRHGGVRRPQEYVQGLDGGRRHRRDGRKRRSLVRRVLCPMALLACPLGQPFPRRRITDLLAEG